MSDRNEGDALGAILVGAAIGAAIGLLFAPMAGKKTREQLGDWLEGVAERGEELWEENRDLIEDAVESGKKILNRRATDKKA